ncbi:serine/threonine protein kinase [Nocardiopsis sp. EMB25]|uniref:serine/threonine protein kinase n=1 Tax=Nocardiopsis sp. EMB25 TaxID=2835867 RepID=UPI002283976D|nr:serine/threonine-protein kinase [Nocardiopsis sp. EMB25]MCY9782758.1 serine/threonine protein kinase [Nocardiopsis sp. EMB25]
MSAQDTEVGGYRLIREIGRGGFGSVHLAEAPGGGLAAVKLLHAAPDTDPRFARMFADEVDAARRISPFCVARVLDADPHADQPWIASEYIEGRTLAEEIRADGPRTGADLQRLAVSTATALTAIHRAGIVHRDLKPENIMMAADGPRVIDFGIARAFEETARFTATAKIGTLHYMAPERLDDVPHLTPAIDVFAWGAVIVYAASGRHAFSGDRQTAVIKRILVDQPDCSGVPDELRDLVTRCLAKEPGDRPSAHRVLNTLLGFPEDGADVDTALNRGNTAATEEIRPLPPTRWETGKVTREDQASPSAPTVDSGAGETEPDPTATSSDPVSPPYRFAGRLHHGVGELAEAMTADIDAASEVFTDTDERAALAAWIIEDLGDTRIDRSLLRKPPKDPDLTVFTFVSQARPDLPPVFEGEDMSLSRFREEYENEASDPLDDPVDPDADPIEFMKVLAAYDCRDPEHGCVRGDGCAELRTLIDDVRSTTSAFEDIRHPYRAWVQGSKHGKEEAFDLQIAEVMFVRALLAPEQWRRLADEDRASLEEEWRAVLPADPPHDAPLPERVAHSLVIRLLCRVLRDMAARHRKLSARRERLEAYLPARRKANKVESDARFITLNTIAAAIVFGVVGWAGLSPDEGPRVATAIGTAIFAYFVSGGILLYIAKEILKDVTDPYAHVKDPKKKLERAKKAIASLGEEIDALGRAREGLPSPDRGG